MKINNVIEMSYRNAEKAQSDVSIEIAARNMYG